MSDTATAADERLFTGYAGRLLLTASLGWATIQAGRLVISPLLPTIIDDLDITPFLAGVSLTALWGVYALCQYPSGRLSDELSRRTLLAAGLVLVTAGFGLLTGAPTYPAFLVGAVVVGLGAGLYPTAARALVSDLFVERRGQAFGLHTASGDIGGALAAGLAIVVLDVALWNAVVGPVVARFGAGIWRTAFPPVVVALALVAALVHVWGREPYVLRRTSLGIRATGRRLLARSRTRWLLVAYSLYAFTWQGTTGFLPTFLQTTKSFPSAVASGGFAALFVVGALIKPVAGSLGDRVSRGVVAAGALFGGALALVGVLLAESVPIAFAAVVVFAAGLMAFPPVMQAYLMDVFPNGSMGGDLGAMRSAYIGFGALGPSYVGYVGGRTGYDVAFAGLVACLLVSATIVLALTRS